MLNTFTDLPSSFYQTKILPHFTGSTGRQLHKTQSSVHESKGDMQDARAAYFRQVDDEMAFDNRPFVMGDTFCVADLSLFFIVASQIRGGMDVEGMDVEAFPSLRRWYEEVGTYPCVAECFPKHWDEDDSNKPAALANALSAAYDGSGDGSGSGDGEGDLALTPLQQAVELLQTLRDNTSGGKSPSRTRRVASTEAISFAVEDVLALLSNSSAVNKVDIHRTRRILADGGENADTVLGQIETPVIGGRRLSQAEVAEREEMESKAAVYESMKISGDGRDGYPGIGCDWSFDVRSIKSNPLQTVVARVLGRTGLLARLPYEEGGSAEDRPARERTRGRKMERFVEEIESKYGGKAPAPAGEGAGESRESGWEATADGPLPYHNMYHAADAANSMWVMMTHVAAGRSKFSKFSKFSPAELFAGLLSAAFHDVGHGGLNNTYLVNSRDALAVRYNDTHVLENMHLAIAFGVARNSECDVFEDFPDGAYRAVRKLCISTVLATDLAGHYDDISELKSDLKNERVGAEMLLKTCMKCCDLANGAKPFEMHEDWSARITKEFHRQGDLEREAGLPVVALFDRELEADLPKNQVGFLKYLVEPLFAAAKDLFEDDLVTEIMGAIEANEGMWLSMQEKRAGEGKGEEKEKGEKGEGEAEREEEVTKKKKPVFFVGRGTGLA